MSKEKKDVGKSKNSKKSSSTVEEGLSNAGYQKEQTRQQQIITTNVVKSLGETRTSKFVGKTNIGGDRDRRDGELKSCDAESLSGENSELSEGKSEEKRDETLKSHDDSFRTGQKSRLPEASTSECQSDGEAKESDHLKKLPISGYVHDTSPIKPSRSNYTYFNFKFQTANGLCDGVCFDKTLYNQVKQKEETQKSVRLSNYSLKRSLHDSSDMTIVINKRTKIESLSECPFDHKAPDKRFTKISEIDEISDFTLVSIIGKVHIRSEQSEVKVEERSIMKLDCKIADETSAIKLTLWDKNIPLVQEGQVYEIVNARVRSYQGEKYLSSNFDTIITTVKSDARKMRVVSQLMEDEESISQNTIIVNRIGGVQEIQRYAVCNSCRRKLGNLQSGLSVCDSCGLSQIKTPVDQTHFSVGVFIGGEHNVLLRVLQDQVESFINLYNEQAEAYNKINVESPTNSEIIDAFLAVRDLKITFNTKTKLVSSISYSK